MGRKLCLENVGRDASLIAHSMFAFGEKSKLVFRHAHAVTKRGRRALADLEAAGYIVRDDGRAAKGGIAWRGTKKLGNPLIDIQGPSADETFVVLEPGDPK
jgi:hypothetical protein